MRLDTHTHFLIDKKQEQPCYKSIKNIIKSCIISGIDGLCITEHREAVGYKNLMISLFKNNFIEGNNHEYYFLTTEGVKLFPAAEIQLENGSNIGVHAPLEVLLNLNNISGFYNLPTLHETLVREGKWFFLVAHHIFWPNKTYDNHHELAQYIHAIEVPAKDIRNIEKYINLANQFDLSTLGGSDSHTFIQIGACNTCIEESVESYPHPLLSEIEKKNKLHSYTPQSEILVELSKLYRSSIIQ